jgi:alkylation response protein AidB-like acyl-CoA dehydrogenase
VSNRVCLGGRASRWPARDFLDGGRPFATVSYTIFEGTSEIQRLVVARSISGLHIA